MCSCPGYNERAHQEKKYFLDEVRVLLFGEDGRRRRPLPGDQTDLGDKEAELEARVERVAADGVKRILEHLKIGRILPGDRPGTMRQALMDTQ